ncbi:AAA family ATPase [Actinomadura vinacea]
MPQTFSPTYNDFNAPHSGPPPFEGASQQPYDGSPMPQPFDGGMLPPPYAQGFQQPDPAQGPPQPPYQPQPPFEGPPQSGPDAPPFDQLPPFGQVEGPPPQGHQLPPQPTEGSPMGYPPAYGPPQEQPMPPAEGGYPPGPPQHMPHAEGYAPGPPQPMPPAEGYGPPQPMPPSEGYGPPQALPPAEGYAPGPPQPMPPSAYPQGPVPQGPMHPGPPPHDQGYPPPPQTAESLSSENLLGERRIAPSSGWRRAVYKATGGNVHPGESQTETRRKDLITRARQQVAGGHHRVAVMSLKGGVGKTTTTTGLGSMLASMRGDRVIAVDANPDRGTLSDKVKLETAATVRDLLNNRDKIHRYADVRSFTSQNGARLEVLASDRDPAVSEAFSADDYSAVAVILEQYYSICITDCGTGLLHSAMAGVLSLADQLVLVSSPSVDGARSASATLDWLEAHDHGHLVRNGVVVLSMVRNRTRSQVDLDKLQAHFESRCRAVVRIPYDDHLEEGAEVELEALAPPTREAYLNLAAVVGDGLVQHRAE